ncbi:hypothetical protein SLA2020_276210 [Shorea laevis]
MEFQEGMMKFVVHKPIQIKWVFGKDTEKQRTTETATPRRKWKLFNKSLFIAFKTLKPQTKATPKEFLCPIFGSLMADPVIVSSGHTFEQACVKACKALGFTPTLVRFLLHNPQPHPQIHHSQLVQELLRRPPKTHRFQHRREARLYINGGRDPEAGLAPNF